MNEPVLAPSPESPPGAQGDPQSRQAPPEAALPVSLRVVNPGAAGPRLSIRFKILIVFATVLLGALGTHLYLATTLFTRDKLAYVYDLNASLVASLAEQSRSSLNVLAKEVVLFARASLDRKANARERAALAAGLFADESDIVRVELYEKNGAVYARQQSYANSAALSLLGLTEEALAEVRRMRPLPIEAIAERRGMIYLQNVSLPPDAPMLSLAFAIDARHIAAVEFRHDRLLRIFGRSRLHEAFLVDERGEVLAHPKPGLVLNGQNLAEHPLVHAALSSPVEQGVIEFVGQDGEERLGAYGQVGLGRAMVLTQISKKEALRAARDLARESSLFALAILLAAFLAALLLSRLLAAPVKRLSRATERIGQGRFDIDLAGYANDEIGDLARDFGRMTAQLKGTQAQLVQSERMAAFGALGAGITHEVKNPITSLVGFAQVAQKKIDDRAKVLELLKIIETESLRCRDILQNFLKFARGGSGTWERLEPSKLVQEASRVLKHQLVIHAVQLETELALDAPVVLGNSGELQQVLVNLAMNAQQAMPKGGKVKVTTARALDGAAVIAVSDNGPGIPATIQDKIFEPFFTTKPPGQGTGLGLAISFSIVRNHKGSLTVQSELGQGATFTIRLPPAGEHLDEKQAAPAPADSTGQAAADPHR